MYDASISLDKDTCRGKVKTSTSFTTSRPGIIALKERRATSQELEKDEKEDKGHGGH
jgi:hypothetical protein